MSDFGLFPIKNPRSKSYEDFVRCFRCEYSDQLRPSTPKVIWLRMP